MDTRERLRAAIAENRVPTVELIIEKHPNLLVNPDPKNGWTNLHYAAHHGHYEMCKLLISLGHDAKDVSLSHEGCTALHIAAQENHERALHYLAQHLERSIDWPNARYETALMVAVAHGNDPIVNLLLDFGADIEYGDQNGTRPIHIAAGRGHVKVLRTLIDRGADTSKANDLGWVPAEYSSNLQVKSYMLTLVADLKRNNLPGTPVKQTFDWH